MEVLKRRKTKKNKRKKKKSGGQAGGEGSRGGGAEAGVASVARKICGALQLGNKRRKQRAGVWETTALLGTHVMNETLNEIEAVKGVGDRNNLFWSLVKAKMGNDLFEQLMTKLDRRGSCEQRPQQQTGSKRSFSAVTQQPLKRVKLDEDVQDLTLRLKRCLLS